MLNIRINPRLRRVNADLDAVVHRALDGDEDVEQAAG